MFLSTLSSALWLMREPRIVLLSGVTTIGFDALLGVAGVSERINDLSRDSITAIILIVLARAWFALSVAATALAILRSRRTAPLFVGVGIVPALSVLFVTCLSLVVFGLGGLLMAPGAPILSIIGLGLFVPGAIMAAVYSQAGMIVIDRKEGPFEAWQASAFLTRGYRGEIMGIWMLVVVAALVAMWIDGSVSPFMSAYSLGPPIAAAVHIGLRVGLDAFGTCCFASVYYELDRIGVENS